MSASWPEKRQILTTEVERVDGPAKVAGRARYSYDIHFSNLLHGAILRSPHAAANILSIDLSPAQNMPGVKAAMVIEKDKKRVRYAGEEIAAVAAETPDIAADALRAIKVEYEVLPHVVHAETARAEGAARVFEKYENAAEPKVKTEGDAQKAFAEAAAVVEGEFRTQVQIHACLETHGLTAKWEGDELTVWASTQGIFSVREGLAKNLGIPESKVRCICEAMGGGFGSKFGPGVEGGAAARLARDAGAPVKMMLDREAEFLAVGNRPSTIQKLRLAADAEGKLTAFSCDGYGTAGFSGGGSSGGGGGGVAWPAPYIYSVPNFSVSIAGIATNTGAGRAFRAPQHPPASFGMESMMDLLAYKLGMDPLEFRMKNDTSEIRQREYKLGAEKFGWKEKYHAPGAGEGAVKRGVGVASATWGGGGRGTKADATINSDGSVEVRCGTQDLGTGARTLVAIVAAETLGLRPEQIIARIGDTNFPPSGGSGGSTTSASVAPAIRDACEKALAALTEKVGAEGTWKERTAKLGLESITAQGEWREGLSGSGVGGVQFAEIEVDTETGKIRVLHITCIQDCGLVVNKLAAVSQANGGIIQGIGFALYEERVMDEATGRMLNADFETYKLPNIADIPTLDVTYLDMPERGVIGLGEPVHIPTASAIANAVHNALGVRVYELPMTPARVLVALKKARA